MSEARYRSVEVRAGAEEGRLDGYAAVWGAAYEIGHRLKEVIARGAFGPEATIPLYVQHRHEAGPVGHATVTVDHHGARVTGTVYVDSDQGLRVWKAAKAGALRGLSVGFLPRQVSRENRDGEVIETVEKAELLETSVVLKGASPEAQIVSVRSQQHVPTQQPPKEDSVSTRQKLADGMKASGYDDPVYREKRLREWGELPDPTKSPAERFLDSPEYRALANAGARMPLGEGRPVKILGAEEFAKTLRTRATVDAAAYPVEARDLFRYQPPTRGGRVLPLLTVVPVSGGKILSAVESSRGQVAAATAYGTSLPEGSLAFAEAEFEPKRLGVWVGATAGVIEDRGLAKRAIDEFLKTDVEREFDRQVLNGDAVGENLRGILNVAGVPSQALGADTRTQALVRASMTVRQAEFAGAMSAVVHPSDFQEILFGLLGAGADREILREAGLEQFVASTLIPSGTILLGDFAAAAVLYVRDGLNLAIGDQHASYWLEGRVAIRAEARVYLEVPRPTALVKLTGM